VEGRYGREEGKGWEIRKRIIEEGGIGAEEG
jgi:hypothetical protein